jgi:hypothetical protein
LLSKVQLPIWYVRIKFWELKAVQREFA